ncbi:hypothetical protein K8R03_03860 [Candidatus Kaiserbacteria bacterium]|nr:hypothetical protein [Candidatus Kaiserbacteria bacterium]
MRASIICSSPDLRSTLEAFAPHVGASDRLSKCPQDADAITLSDSVRGIISGTTPVIFGIGCACAKPTMAALQIAGRSHQCVAVMTLEGYRAAYDFITMMRPIERNMLGSRLVVTILAGDHEESFQQVGRIESKTRTFIGGLQWADTTREKMAAFIGASLAQKAA